MGTSAKLAMTFLTSFLVSGGGAYLAAASNGADMSVSLGVTAGLTGLIAAAQAVQKLYEEPPAPVPAAPAK